MGEVGAEQPLCACYKECQEFQKVVELKDTGLVVYCHTKRAEDVEQSEVVESAINTSRDVFILHNTKDVKITPSDLIPALEKNDISCPRCRKIFERAQELLRKVTSIGRKNVLGVCDHCRKKAQSIKKPCNECEEIVKKFISIRGERKEDTKTYIKIWLSKMGHLLKDAITSDKLKKVRTRAYSELQIDRLYQYSPKSRREPEIKQMFSSETRKSDTNLYTEMNDINLKEGNTVEKSVVFSKPVEPMETTFDATPYGGGIINRIIPGLDPRVKSDATFVGPYEDFKEPPKTPLKDSRGKQDQSLEYYDDPSVEVREAMKKKHDLSLRHMIKPEKESVTPYSVSHRPKIYEIPKVAPWEQQETQEQFEYYESDLDVKLTTKKLHDLSSKHGIGSQSLQSISLKYVHSKTSQKDLRESRRQQDYVSEHYDVVKDAKVTSKRKPETEFRDLHPVLSHKTIKHEISKKSQKHLRESRREKDHFPEKLDESVMNVKGATKRKFDLNLKHMMGLETETRDPSSGQYRTEKYDQGKIKKTTYDSEEIPKKVKKREDRYLANEYLNLQRSFAKFSHEMEKPEQAVIKSKIRSKKHIKADEIAENIPKQQFSFFFPKEKKPKHHKLGARSSHLIKNTQEKLRQRAEEEKKIREEEEVKKLEEEEKKKNAREEKRRLADETKKYVDEQTRHPEDWKHTEKELEITIGGEKERKIRVEETRQDESNQSRDSILESEVKGKKPKESEDAKKYLNQKTESKDKLDKETEGAKKYWKEKLEPKDRVEEIKEKSKKDQKSKPEPRDKIDEVSDKTKKYLESKPEPREKADEVLRKTQKDLVSKSEPKKIIDDVSAKAKEDVKAKPEPKDKIGEVMEKRKKDLMPKPEPREKDDEVFRKTQKDLMSKSEPKEKIDDVSAKAKEDVKAKPEPKDKIGEVLEKGKKELKSKPEKKEKNDEVLEKVKKGSISKSEPKDKFDTESEKEKKSKIQDTDKNEVKALKEREKQQRSEQIKIDQEDKDRKKQLEQLRKEKESGSRKKQDGLKEAEESKKKVGYGKDKELPSKKMEESLKDKGVHSKKEDSSKKKRKLSADIEEPLTKKQQSSKEAKELSKEQQEILKGKEDLSKKEQGLSKELKESSKKKRDSIKEKEEPNKGKENIISSKKQESKDEKSKVLDESKTAKGGGMEEAQFKKLQAELKKEKEENLKRKKQQEAEEQKARDLADKREKEERDRKSGVREAKAIIKPDPNIPLTDQSNKKTSTKQTKSDLDMNKIKIRNTSSDDLVLRLVRIKQTATGKLKTPRPCDIDPKVKKAHKCHHISGLTSSYCLLCNNSELEFDVESYEKKQNIKSEIAEIIIGEKIYKYKPPRLEKTKDREVIPLLFQSVLQNESPQTEIVHIIPQETEPVKKPALATLVPIKDTKGVEPVEPSKGIIRYALSDRSFIDKGWTMLPTEKVVRKMNVYRMRPAHPEFDWFEHNKNKRLMNYDTGEKLAEFDDNGRGRWYYRNGRLALDYYDAEENNAQQRFVIYSSGEPDERGRTHPITILATFDYLGNGIVFDHAGKIRLKYNQTEGVVLDRGIGPVTHWKWHTLNDPPVLQQVMIDTQMAHKDPEIIRLGTSADTKTRPDNEEMLAIEFDNFIKEKSKKLSQKFKPFQIKMKALKINEHFSLKVLDQATVYLIFRDGSTNLKLNIGMILDHQEIVDTDTAEVGEVSNNLERFPARTDSLAGLQRSVAYAQRYERQRTERERRLRPPEPCASADNLVAAASPPLRHPLRTMPTGSTSSAGYCKCRKPTNNLYYNTRLL